MPRLRPLHLEAVVELLLASLQVRSRPDAAVLRRLGVPSEIPHATAPPDLTAISVGRAVAGVARRLPWTPLCLPQAMAASRLLDRRGLPRELHLSARTGGGGLEAHAWVTSAGHPVIGGDGRGHMRVVTLEATGR